MISRKSIVAIAESTLVLTVGSTTASFATNATPAPKKSSVSRVHVQNAAAHKSTKGVKAVKAKVSEKSKKSASVALTTWRRGHLAAKRAYKAELTAAKIVEKAAIQKATISATKVADLAAAKKVFADAKTAAKAKFNAAITALGAKPVK